MKETSKRYGGIQMRGTRVHKVKKYDLLDEYYEQEVEEALEEFYTSDSGDTDNLDARGNT